MDITSIRGPGRQDEPASVAPTPRSTDATGELVDLPTGRHPRRITLERTRLGYRIPGVDGVELELVEDDPPFYEAAGPLVDRLDLPRGLRIDRKAGRLAADIIRRAELAGYGQVGR